MEEHLVAATRADPSHDRALIRLARHYRSTDRPERALNLYAHVRELNPTSKGAYLQAAATLYGMGRFEASLDQLEDGLEVHPEDEELRETYAQLRQALGMSPR